MANQCTLNEAQERRIVHDHSFLSTCGNDHDALVAKPVQPNLSRPNGRKNWHHFIMVECFNRFSSAHVYICSEMGADNLIFLLTLVSRWTQAEVMNYYVIYDDRFP